MTHDPQSFHCDNCLVDVVKRIHHLQLDLGQTIFIAYSGGIDSHVLLHLCAGLERLKGKIVAVYINHGLQVESDSWGSHCERVCSGLGVKFISLSVNAQAAPGQSPEEVARNARYAALKPLLTRQDVLLLGQHREDQLETVLLQLFRGSGLKGLSGMPENQSFGKGRLVRPLLAISKAAILAYAQHHALTWIEDPSNQQTEFDRNLLRNDIIPKLKRRWPSLDRTVTRAALHCGDAQNMLSELAGDLLMKVVNTNDNTLQIALLANYTSAQQQLILRQWLQSLGLKMPSHAVIQQILQSAVAARQDADPVIVLQNHTIRRYRNVLYCLKQQKTSYANQTHWPKNQNELRLSEDVFYTLEQADSGIAITQWRNASITIKFRSGGEKISLPGRQGYHSLKRLYQEKGIPPWDRESMPLIYLDGKLAAVGEHWITQEFYKVSKELCYRIIRHKINPKGNDDEADVD